MLGVPSRGCPVKVPTQTVLPGGAIRRGVPPPSSLLPIGCRGWSCDSAVRTLFDVETLAHDDVAQSCPDAVGVVQRGGSPAQVGRRGAWFQTAER